MTPLSKPEKGDSPRKAYIITEGVGGYVTALVYANSAREIRENWPAVEREGIDTMIHPTGLRDVHRASQDDR